MVQYVTQFNSPNYTKASESLRVFGAARVVRSIVIHHWDDPARNPTFSGTVNWLCRSGGSSSAHLVVEAGRAAWLVDAADVAWASGGYANPRTIAIELNPRASEADYISAAEVVADLRHHYGNLSLYPHHWFAGTKCPGRWNLTKLDRMAYTAETKKYGTSSESKPPMWL